MKLRAKLIDCRLKKEFGVRELKTFCLAAVGVLPPVMRAAHCSSVRLAMELLRSSSHSRSATSVLNPCVEIT